MNTLKTLSLYLLVLVLVACSNPNAQPNNDVAIVTFSLSGDQAVSLELRYTTGEALFFDAEHNVVGQGAQRLSLHRDNPEITLSLQPDTYMVTTSTANQLPSTSIHAFHEGQNEVVRVETSQAALPNPEDNDSYTVTYVAVSGMLAQIDVANQQLSFRELSSLPLKTTDDTIFFNELFGETGDASQFWQQVTTESWVAVEGSLGEAGYQADYVYMFQADDAVGIPEPFDEATQVSVMAEVATVEAAAQQLSLRGVDLSYSFNELTYYDVDYAQSSSSAFWQRLEVGHAVVLAGEAVSDMINVNYIHALSGSVVAPPSPDFVVIEGLVSRVEADVRQLWLEDFDDITVTVNENTFYLSDKRDSGELSAEEFWATVSTDSFVIVHGELINNDSGTLLAYEIFELSDSPAPPPYALEAEVRSVDANARSFVFVTGETVVVDASTYYSSSRYGEWTAEAFWSALEPGMVVSVYGDVDGAVVLAYGLHLIDVDGPIHALEGMVKSFDAAQGLILLDGNSLGFELTISTSLETSFWMQENDAIVQVAQETFFDSLLEGDLVFAEGVLNEASSELEAFRVERFSYDPYPYVYLEGFVSDLNADEGWFVLDGAVGVADGVVGEMVYTWEETQFFDDNRNALSAESFWSQLKTGEFVMLEGRYADASAGVVRLEADVVYLVGEYTQPVYLEGSVVDFDPSQQLLYLDRVDSPIVTSTETLYYDGEGANVSADAFWQSLQVGDGLWLEGVVQDGQIIAWVLAHFTFIPEPWWLEGAVLDFDANAQTLSLEGYEGLVIQATADTYYLNQQGVEVGAEDFWRSLAVADVIVVQGYERDGQILAESMFYPIYWPEPLWLEGMVRELNSSGQSFYLDDAFITVSDETLYIYAGITMEAAEFWATVKEGDYVGLAGWPLDIPEFTVEAVLIEIKQDEPYP